MPPLTDEQFRVLVEHISTILGPPINPEWQQDDFAAWGILQENRDPCEDYCVLYNTKLSAFSHALYTRHKGFPAGTEMVELVAFVEQYIRPRAELFSTPRLMTAWAGAEEYREVSNATKW